MFSFHIFRIFFLHHIHIFQACNAITCLAIVVWLHCRNTKSPEYRTISLNLFPSPIHHHHHPPVLVFRIFYGFFFSFHFYFCYIKRRVYYRLENVQLCNKMNEKENSFSISFTNICVSCVFLFLLSSFISTFLFGFGIPFCV